MLNYPFKAADSPYFL